MKTRLNDFWGLCPKCKEEPQFLNLYSKDNIFQSAWCVCPDCKVVWPNKCNLSQDEETKEQRKRDAELLGRCVIVEPYFYLSTRIRWWHRRTKFKLRLLLSWREKASLNSEILF